ncbi:MAG: acetylglutamate kinase [Clostridia bacterium]|nr:acetylglutamate kinase [Clostridia bacterium]
MKTIRRNEHDHQPIYVIKYGGSIMDLKDVKGAFIEDLIELKKSGIQIVLVHGGGKNITERLKKVGLETKFLMGYRDTTHESMKEIEMVLSGEINGSLVLELNLNAVNAIGLSGKDGKMLKARSKWITYENKPYKMEHVGAIEKVDMTLLKLLLKEGFTPVVSPIGFDDQGKTYNINADDVAGSIASHLKAEKLFLLTDVSGILKDISEPTSLIKLLNLYEANQLYETDILKGGMIPKMQCAINALKEGCESVYMMNGIIEHNLMKCFKHEDFCGTTIVKEYYV